jgi:hypothetical protein
MVPFKEALIEALPRKCHHEECHYDDSHGAIQRGINGSVSMAHVAMKSVIMMIVMVPFKEALMEE